MPASAAAPTARPDAVAARTTRQRVLGGPARRRDGGTASHARTAASACGLRQRPRAGAASSPTPASRGTRGHSGAHTSPRQLPRSQRRAEQPARPDEPQRPVRHASRAVSTRPASRLAMATALVARTRAPRPRCPMPSLPSSRTDRGCRGGAAASPPSSRALSTLAQPEPGPVRAHRSRQADPAPLTIAAAVPGHVHRQRHERRADRASRTPTAPPSSSGPASSRRSGQPAAIRSSARPTCASSQGLMGTIGVLNLSTAKAATKAVRAADASDFIGQLTAQARPDPQDRPGHGHRGSRGQGPLPDPDLG